MSNTEKVDYINSKNDRKIQTITDILIVSITGAFVVPLMMIENNKKILSNKFSIIFTINCIIQDDYKLSNLFTPGCDSSTWISYHGNQQLPGWGGGLTSENAARQLQSTYSMMFPVIKQSNPRNSRTNHMVNLTISLTLDITRNKTYQRRINKFSYTTASTRNQSPYQSN